MRAGEQAAGTLSLSAPSTGAGVAGVLPWACLVREFGLQRLWLGQSTCLDPMSAVSWAAGRGAPVPLGTGVSLLPGQHPVGLALSLRAVASATGLPVLACLSPGDPSTQLAFAGARWPRPLSAAREFLLAVRALLTGGPCIARGEHVQLTAALPGPDLGDRVGLGLGVLRPRAARLAGEVADAALTWLAPTALLAGTLVPLLRASAAEHGRPAPRVVATVHAALARPAQDPLAGPRRALSVHVELDHYRDALRRGGVALGDRHGDDALRALVEAGVYTVGSPDDVADAVRSAWAAGADEVSLALDAPPGSTWRTLREDWAAVTGALAGAPAVPPARRARPVAHAAPAGGTP